jgi:hypothetical protein
MSFKQIAHFPLKIDENIWKNVHNIGPGYNTDVKLTM